MSFSNKHQQGESHNPLSSKEVLKSNFMGLKLIHQQTWLLLNLMKAIVDHCKLQTGHSFVSISCAPKSFVMSIEYFQ